MTLTDIALQEIRSNLVNGVETHNRRQHSRRRRRLAVAPVAVVAVGGVLVATRSGGDAAYAITNENGTIRVEVSPAFDDVKQLERSLAGVGLQATVVHLRSAPSLDGVVEVSSHNNENSGALEFDDGEFVIDVEAVTGEIEILIYTAAQDGETYQAAPSVFAPGEQLAGLNCAFPDSPLPSSELERRANEVGIADIVWIVQSGTGPDTTFSEDVTERPDGAVTGAQMRTAGTLMAFVDADGTTPAATSVSMSSGAHFRTAPTCTPELAAPWS